MDPAEKLLMDIFSNNHERDQMTVKIEKYNRVSFPVNVVEVTSEDMEDIAKWCKGVIISTPDGSSYIQVEVHKAENPRHTQAHVGDRIVQLDGRGFRVYTKPAFDRNFVPVGQDRPNPQIAVSSHHSV